MKNTRTLACVAGAYIAVFIGYVITPRSELMRTDALFNFSLGGLTVGLATTLAALGDRLLVNRRLARLTAPMAEQLKQDFESLGRSPDAVFQSNSL